jgi:hypothetical protein
VEVVQPKEVEVAVEFLVQTAVFVEQQARAAVPPGPGVLLEGVQEQGVEVPVLFQ